MSDKVDYLDEDPVISSQKYCVVSVLTPKNWAESDEKKSTMYTFKVRGSYETVEEAQKRIQYLNSIDSNVNIYLAEVGKWCPFEDDPEKAKDAVYKDEELNRLMKGYKENQEKAKELFNERKKEMVAAAVADTNEKKEKLKIEEALKQKTEEVASKEDKVKEGKKEVEQKKEEIHEREDKIKKLADEVSAAKKKYEEMLAKSGSKKE